ARVGGAELGEERADARRVEEVEVLVLERDQLAVEVERPGEIGAELAGRTDQDDPETAHALSADGRRPASRRAASAAGARARPAGPGDGSRKASECTRRSRWCAPRRPPSCSGSPSPS